MYTNNYTNILFSLLYFNIIDFLSFFFILYMVHFKKLFIFNLFLRYLYFLPYFFDLEFRL